ncbi:MAG: carboxymuconolactone decarboxylase, partial [Frateuria sp.]|nr:carboxymuconolactone decarboxylase [Frateuria sp.]
MSNTTRAEPVRRRAVLAAGIGLASSLHAPGVPAQPSRENRTMNANAPLSRKQQTIAPIAAAMAVGDMPQLNTALNEGLNA